MPTSTSSSRPSLRVQQHGGRLTRRRDRAHPDHHLWRNGRRWWIAFTVIHDGWRQERVRHSLGTTDVLEARCRRDALLRLWDGGRTHVVNRCCEDPGPLVPPGPTDDGPSRRAGGRDDPVARKTNNKKGKAAEEAVLEAARRDPEHQDDSDDPPERVSPSGFKGYDMFMAEPGVLDRVHCNICGRLCVVTRNAYGPTGWIQAMMRKSTRHDRFDCPNQGTGWHMHALDWLLANEGVL